MQVIIKECKQYDVATIKTKITNALGQLGFDFSKLYNANVALKPNLLTSAAPESAVVTHPLFFKAVVQIVKEYGGAPILVESPAVQSLQRVMKKTGYDAIVTEEDVQVADTSDCIIIHNPNAQQFKRFEVPKVLHECDVIFNLPKFKTHALTHITCAVKNLFGTIHGLKKSQWHIKAKTQYEFAQMLLDLYEAYITDSTLPNTMVHIADAIIAMEGDGPGPSGVPKYMGIIGASYNAIAVDYVLAKYAAFNIENISTVTMGIKRGLCTTPETIEVIQDTTISQQVCKPPKKSGSTKILANPFINKMLKNWVIAKPVPDSTRCTLCYQCKQICPVQAISTADKGKKIPLYDYSKCIRCYCCMEICPESAITLSNPLLQKIIS